MSDVPTPAPTSSPPTPALQNPVTIGYLLIVLSTLCFSINNNLAKESYGHGVTVDTMLVGRCGAIVLLMTLWFWVRQTPPSIPKGLGKWVFFAAIMFGGNSWALLSSFDLLPVSLAILVFYLFPFIVGIVSALLGIERLHPLMVLGLIVAFGGLFLALDASGELNALGVGLAFLAGLTMTGNILATGRMLRRGMSAVALAYWVMTGSTVIFGLKLWFSGTLGLPGSGEGWVVLAGTILTLGIAFVTFYMALALVSGTKTALVMNLEPVFTIIMAVFLFAEPFGPLQWLGATLVMIAILGVTLMDQKK